MLCGLVLSSVVGDLLDGDGEVQKSATKITNEQQQLPVPEPLLNTEPPSPYEMVAHSDYNNRLLVQLKQPSSSQKPEYAANLPFGTTLLPTIPTRKRSTNEVPRRTRYSPATTEEDPNRALLKPERYYDSYGEWHHSGDDTAHWATHPHGPTQLYYNHGNGGNWDWKPHPHHHSHPQQQHHSNNVIAEILDNTALYPPYHFQHQQHHGLLGLQLFVLLHPVLMLGTVSFLMSLINAVLGLVDKVKLPLVRAQDVDRIAAGTATPAGVRDGRDEHMIDQLYQHLNVAIDHLQRNGSFAQGRSRVL
uniref:Uncharacterized protein n=1 Tax=Anopheles culicifacies TaxID=139723 RepID=A0A182MTU4_9DIPT